MNADHTQEMALKKFAIAGVFTAVMVAFASNAMALDRQATPEEMDNATNWQQTRDFGGAHASARTPAQVRINRAGEQQGVNFQAVGVY
jgi:hypothetical protein